VTPDQLSAIRARLDAADTDFRLDIDHVEEEFGFIAGVRVVSKALPYDSGIGTEQDKDDKAHAFCDLMSHAKTDLRALLDEVERLTAERDAARLPGLALSIDLEADRAFDALQPSLGTPVPPERRIRRQADVDAAFARGAEAMRTALLQRVSWGSDLADRIRGEPVPEDK
jgi:hypothetical protein